MSLDPRSTALIIAAAAITIAAFVVSGPIPQDPAYHLFADTRTLFGVANFWNVFSNLAFLVAGAWGLYFLQRYQARLALRGLEPAYATFFLGVLLTAFGSAWYHLAPANGPLVWDRLPMTIGFAGLFSVVVGEFVSVVAARRLLVPMLIAGALSVVYWGWSEAQGSGDLRPYAIVAFLPMLLILAILLLYRPPVVPKRYFWFMLLSYALAKAAELFDTGIFAAGQLLSGHTLKHLFAALTPAILLFALHKRRLRSGGPCDD